MTTTAILGARVLSPHGEPCPRGLLIERGRIRRLLAAGARPEADRTVELDGGWLLPGFVDTQVNGGGGVLFNDTPTVEGIAAIAAAHRRFGTTGLLPTLISDGLEVVDRAIAAVDQAIAAGVPGVLGIHVEGPFLNPEKHGIHDPGKFRILDDEALALLTRPGRGARLLTLAPELAPPGAIRALTAAGVIVSAGHSMASHAEARIALDEGLAGFTHLFNAMTQLGSREPGMVGAALDDRASMFGLIVDGHHVAPATLRIALAGRGLDRAMLVTDAMPPAGTDMTRFTLMGREIVVDDGTLRAEDGTLAGAALTMADAVRNATAMLGLDIGEASRLASANPARFLRLDRETGAIAPGLRADLVHLDEDLRMTRTWIAGEMSDVGE
ncbi:N-acetylglucosamine-6-phosphate deacetylase [Sphingomonas sp. DT-204]|uniref:N-acetylglucosamine-6-phosphate deacetylase n=1 Tax=Sphingomonas sp. DT-204 TaxID=3396166 RepID=UPI003F1A61F9